MLGTATRAAAGAAAAAAGIEATSFALVGMHLQKGTAR